MAEQNLPQNAVFRVNSTHADLTKAAHAQKQQFVYFLKQNLGNVDAALDSLAIERLDYLHWLSDDIDFRYAVTAVIESVGDFVESKLMQKIKEGDTYAITFFCKTKLKHRGYAERKGDEGGQQPAQTTVNVQVMVNKPMNNDNIQEAIIITNDETNR